MIALRPHVMIAESTYHADIADELRRGAIAVLEKANVTYELVQVPGTYEIPGAIQIAIKAMQILKARRRFSGYIALGCLIKGETDHYGFVSTSTMQALQDLTTNYTIALGMGILTVETHAQAVERALVSGRNHGGQAAQACVDMIEVKAQFGLYPRD